MDGRGGERWMGGERWGKRIQGRMNEEGEGERIRGMMRTRGMGGIAKERKGEIFRKGDGCV